MIFPAKIGESTSQGWQGVWSCSFGLL